MTTTHDLPTVAGWWEGTDIGWREKLHMGGDTPAQRDADRRALWSAFMASGAATEPPPPPQDGAAAAYAAATHLGRAGCTLALLPVEDALSLPRAAEPARHHRRAPELAPPPAGRCADALRPGGFLPAPHGAGGLTPARRTISAACA